MPKPSHMHHSDEFGKPLEDTRTGWASRAFFGRRTLAAPGSIERDAAAERESGETPKPPPFSMRALIIGLVIAFAAGAGLLLLLMQYGPRIVR
jgi:hypothetical protein